MKNKTESIIDLEGCLPKLDHIITLEEMDKGIADAIREDWLRFERQSRDVNAQQETALERQADDSASFSHTQTRTPPERNARQ